jgi:hypothetical protein
LIEIPVLPELQGELDELPAHQLTFLITDQGKAFTAAGFGNWFRDMAATRAANRRKLAQGAVHRLKARTTTGKPD